MKKHLILFSFFVITSCDCCESYISLCDLLIQALEAPEQITVGEAAEVTAQIFNEPDSDDCSEETSVAEATFDLIEVFLQNDLGQWDFVGSKDNIEQFSIAAGNALDILEFLVFNQPGDYRIDFYTDSPDGIDERNEGNNLGNFSTTGRVQLSTKNKIKQTNNYAYTYITVLPKKDFVNEGKPIVEFLK